MLATLDNSPQKIIVYTATNEPLMPVRLYYKIHNEYLLIKALKKLKCVSFEWDNKEFVISYYKEAKRLGLDVHYQDVPQELYPVALAYGHIRNYVLHMDLRSLKRAVYIIDFVAKYIPPTIMEITHFANSNKLTVTNDRNNSPEILDMDYDKFFDDNKIYHVDLQLELDKIKEIYKQEKSDDPEEKWERFESYIRTKESDDYHEVEKIAISYDKRSHNRLTSWLAMRSIIKSTIAMEHYSANTSYSSIDAIKKLLSRINDDLEEDD
jgi:hypothetical protein